MPDYDCIIVGAGSAGCVMANRLSEDPHAQVLPLEAGPPDDSMWINIPVGFMKLLNNPRYSWRFDTEPEPNLNGRSLPVPRGKTLGGSSSINGMVYVRGNPLDHDTWAQFGNRGWSYESVLPTSKNPSITSQAAMIRAAAALPSTSLLCANAPSWPMLSSKPRWPRVSRAIRTTITATGKVLVISRQRRREWPPLVDGARLSGSGEAPPQSAHRDRGARHPDLPRWQGRRWGRLLASRGGAGGSLHRRGDPLRPRGEVAASSRTVRHRRSLELQSAGITVRHELRGVGENYRDHYAPRMNWRVTLPITLNEQTRGVALVKEIVKYYALRRGVLSLAAALVHGFVRTGPELEVPDLQYLFSHASYSDPQVRALDRAPGMTVTLYQCCPESTGSIHAKSPDPAAAPAIRPNYLADDWIVGSSLPV